MDVVCVGETMVGFVATGEPTTFRAIAAGAASNVATGLARLGIRTQWLSRLGDDDLGRLVESIVTSAGVEVVVERDPRLSTGTLVKHVHDGVPDTRYYRSRSAARALSVSDLDRAATSNITHVTGITAAISPSGADLVDALVRRRTGRPGLVSFDVNHRRALWPDDHSAADALLPLARQADIVFVGDDEAERLFGTSDSRELAERMLVKPGQQLVLKRGARGASLLTPADETWQEALAVEVVDLTGAGDAFAAGFLAGLLFGWAPRSRLQLGHLMASRTVGVIEDVPPAFTAEELVRMDPDWVASLW